MADTLLHLATPLSIIAFIAIVFLLRGRARGVRPGSPEIVADGATIVPVRGIYLRRRGLLSGATQNSINPRFVIAQDGFAYRVFSAGWLAFSEIEHVEVRERFGRVYLLFLNATGPRLLSVNVGHRDGAKRVLDALPPGVVLTPEAATIRDGTPAAGMPRLPLYDGRFA